MGTINERNIEIIGEAMNRILRIDESITITNARKIVDAHSYITIKGCTFRICKRNERRIVSIPLLFEIGVSIYIGIITNNSNLQLKFL